MELLDQVEFDPETGLIPAVVQAHDGRVLMLAYMNRRALRRTLERGRVTFWSRSREELWEKGATSGDWLEAQEVRTDCDHDALLVRASPHGPACHTGEPTCFDAGVRAAVDADPAPPGAAPAEDASDGGPDGGEAAPEPGEAPRADAGPARGSPGRGPDDGEPDLSDAGRSPAPVLASVLEEMVAVIARRDRDRPVDSYTASLLEGGPAEAARKVGEEALEVVLSALEEPDRLAEESADLLYHLAVLWRSAGLPPDAVGRELAGRRGDGTAAGDGPPPSPGSSAPEPRP